MQRLAICPLLVLLAASAAWSGGDRAGARALLCRMVKRPPVVDGSVDDPAWKGLSPLGGFVTAREGEPANPPQIGQLRSKEAAEITIDK